MPQLCLFSARAHFTLSDAISAVHTELDVKPGTVGATEDRKFPSLELVALVGRRPDFYVMNAAGPVFAFVPMALLQFCCVREQADARLSVSLAIVLTAVAHKYSITTLVPPISYLTYLDKYVFASFLLIVFITLQGGLIGSLESFYCRTQAIFADDNAEVIRRLAVAGGGISKGPDTTSESAQMPIGYADDDCPYSPYRKFNKFDWIDAGFLSLDLVLWCTLHVWALIYYLRVAGAFSRRVEAITERKLAARKIHVAPKRSGTCAKITDLVQGKSRDVGSATQRKIDQAIAKKHPAVVPNAAAESPPVDQPRACPRRLRKSMTMPLRKDASSAQLKNWSHLPRRTASDEGEASPSQRLQEPARCAARTPSRPPPALLFPSPQRVLASHGSSSVANVAVAAMEEATRRARLGLQPMNEPAGVDRSTDTKTEPCVQITSGGESTTEASQSREP